MNNIFSFELPIYYLENKSELSDNLKTDLEIQSDTDSIYKYLIGDNTQLLSNKILGLYNKYYTNNVGFLNDTQDLIKRFKPLAQIAEITAIEEIYSEIIGFNITVSDGKSVSDSDLAINKGFNTIYQYVDIPYFEFLNSSASFLQGLTLYNLTSPVISLLIPIIMLIIPFFLIRLKNIPITFSVYVDTLLTVIKNHPIGQAINEFGNVGWDRKVFLLVSVAFYFINIYQNITSCAKFYTNISKIQNNLFTIQNFIDYSIDSIDNINGYCNGTYSGFVERNNSVKQQLDLFNSDLNSINLDTFSLKNVGQFGSMMKSFYQLFKNDYYKSCIEYCLLLDIFITNIQAIQTKISNKVISFCAFKNNGSCQFKKLYYAPLVNVEHVDNSYKLDKNMIITGPNAAGKTTLLKATMFNIILSQQFGVGFYSSAKINPYKYIHSYINIPDTSQRDSLFQSEARRCKTILDTIITSKQERHFCIFDELYSGTNPNEAISSAYSFLLYLSKFDNVDFLLTTHYTSLCKLFEDNKYITNFQMDIEKNTNLYNYKLIKGISFYKGGIKVLKDLDYPTEIIDNAEKIIQDIII